MKKLALFTALLLVLIIPVGEATPEEVLVYDPSSRNIEIPYAHSPPVLDGDLGLEEWRSSVGGWYFDANDGMSHREKYNDTINGDDESFGGSRDLSVLFYVLYDEEYLYVGANVTDEDIVVDSYPADHSKFYRDDGLEVLIDGANDEDPNQRAGDPWPGWEDGTTLLILADDSYHHDYSSGHGYPLGRDFGPDAAWYGVASTNPERGYYTVEMRIRLANISSPAPNSTIGLNIGVNDDDTGGLSKTALKWAGGNFTPYVNDVYRNETKWGDAKLRTYVDARAQGQVYVDEGEDLMLDGTGSVGNHPDFETGANYTWRRTSWNGTGWDNETRYGAITLWNFDDPTRNMRITLTVTDPADVYDRDPVYVTVNDTTPPTVETFDVEASEEVLFVYSLNATDVSGIDRCVWNVETFPEFTTPYPGFNLTFDHPGDYSASVEVFDRANNSASASFFIFVKDAVPPEIDFDTSNRSAVSGEPLLLNASGMDDNPLSDQDDWLNFTWFFSLGSRSQVLYGSDITVDLNVVGTWRCTLEVSDGANNTGRVGFNVTVSDLNPPVPAFTLREEVPEDTPVNVTGLSSTDDDPDYPIGFEFVWHWGVVHSGGSFSDTEEGSSASLLFPEPGTGWVNLTVADPSGNVGYLNRSVDVTDITPPVAAVSLPEYLEEDMDYTLDLTGSEDNVGIKLIEVVISRESDRDPVWSTPPGGLDAENLSGDQLSTLEGLVFSIEDPGTYVVSLYLEDPSGLSGTNSITVSVRDRTPPVAVINSSLVVLFAGETLYLSGSESYDNHGDLEYVWSIDGAGTQIRGRELSFKPSVGEYNITLTVTDESGYFDTAWCQVIVRERSDPDGDGDMISLYLWIAVLVAFLVALILAVFYMLRSKQIPRSGVVGEE